MIKFLPYRLIIVVSFFFAFVFAKCHGSTSSINSFSSFKKEEIEKLVKERKADILFVASWNVENLFDIYDDPLKNDDEFLPTSKKEWTEERYEKKLSNLARVIRAMNDGEGPDLLGMQEVENEKVANDLIKIFFKDKNYKISHMEGPDDRGIDCALIFNADKFEFLGNIGDTVSLYVSEDNLSESVEKLKTRLILTTKLLFFQTQDTFYVIVNHWPSRRGGQQESEINRIAAAQTLKRRVNLIFNETFNPKVIIVGDFNDEPTNVSIERYLGALPLNAFEECNKMPKFNLYNLAYDKHKAGEGTLKHQDKWNLIDQIIVNGSLLNPRISSIIYYYNTFEIFKPNFMVTQKGKYAGTPFPTFAGDRYLGGYSDHFPVIAKFVVLIKT